MKCIWCSNPEGMDKNGGSEISIQEILKECISSRMMFFSGGGVTFTGGEATMQFEELKELLKLLKEENIHTAIETNGTSVKLQELLPYTDYLIMDFKHYDGNVLRKYTGVDNITTKANYEQNCKNGRQQHIRIPLINEINTDNPKAFAEYFSGFNTDNTVFEFLPYHEYGKDKWKEEYKVKNGFITKEITENFLSVFNEHNLKIITT